MFRLIQSPVLLVALFGGMGIGGLLGIRIAIRKTRRMNEVAAMSPNEPWLWDTSTTSGEYLPTPAWIGWTLMAVIWNAISWPFVSLMQIQTDVNSGDTGS